MVGACFGFDTVLIFVALEMRESQTAQNTVDERMAAEMLKKEVIHALLYFFFLFFFCGPCCIC